MSLKKSLWAVCAALWPIVSWSAACPPNLRGDATDWAIAVCYGKVETDDPGHPEVSRCLSEMIKADRISKSNANSCSLKRKYRRVWCKQLVHHESRQIRGKLHALIQDAGSYRKSAAVRGPAT